MTAGLIVTQGFALVVYDVDPELNVGQELEELYVGVVYPPV
jgi:hypothetical protein